MPTPLAVGASDKQAEQFEECSSEQELIERQRALEDHMIGEGGKRFRKEVTRAQVKKEASTAGAGVKLLRHAIDPVEAGIQALLDQKGKRGPKHLAHRWLSLCDPAAVAYITARVIVNGIHSVTPYRTVATDIAGMLLDELRYRRLEKARPALFKYKTARLPGSNYSHNKKVLDQTMRWALEHKREQDEELDVSDLTMTEQQRTLVGAKLIDIFVQTTGLVRLVSRQIAAKGTGRAKRWKQELYLEATDETKTWLSKRNAMLEFLTPVNLPTIIPPRDWGKGERGGYHFALRNKYELVRGASAAQNARVKAAHIPLVYEAINRIQATAWKINPQVFALVEQIVERGKSLGGLSFDLGKEEIPAKPVDIATNEEARKRWRKAARAVHERNHARKLHAKEAGNVLLAARKVVHEDRIYFPCSLDFRGRIYPLTHYLTPQGDDLSKALLTFADAKPLGDDGAYWLAIHGANCLDETPDGQKVKMMTMQERASWIQKNTLRICQVANDPFADLWWTEADEPLQFYAFCCEWRGFYEMYKQGQGTQYVCGLPISQDGSCNGLQHFSAMLRDPIGGKATNLTPEERPQDVYQAVADDTQAQVAADPSWYAKRWLASGLVGRKLCKRPTMTFCYGSKRYGMAQQTVQFLDEQEDKGELAKGYFTLDEKNCANEAAQWMAERIWIALQGTVVAASRAMNWMQECARLVIAATNQPVEWTVPVTGFPVRQDYFTTRFKQIETVLAGQVVKPSVLEVMPDVLAHKQANAIAPNVVHSLDAAALMMTVVGAAECGVTSFAMVHDSYGTVPADCGVLGQVTREAFTSLYRDNDVIGHLAECWQAQAVNSKKPLPKPPEPGTLDINGVLESTYFFS